MNNIFRIVLALLRTCKNDIAKKYKMTKVSFLWRQNNRHNKTVVSNPQWQELFPLERVSVGKHTYGGLHVVPYNKYDGNLKIGSYCSIARNVQFLLGGNHDYLRVSTYPFKLVTPWGDSSFSKGDIVIDDDVWICENVIILSGVHVGQGAVLAANSVVSRDVEPYEIVGGNPMRHIKYRFSEQIRTQLIKLHYDDLNEFDLQKYKELMCAQIDESKLADIIDFVENKTYKV